MPVILMSGRWHKKLNLLIQFCNSNFHKIIFWNISKQTGFKLAFKIGYLATFFSILSYHSPPRPTRAKAVRVYSLKHIEFVTCFLLLFSQLNESSTTSK